MKSVQASDGGGSPRFNCEHRDENGVVCGREYTKRGTLYRHQRVKHGAGHIRKKRSKPAAAQEEDGGMAVEENSAVVGLAEETAGKESGAGVVESAEDGVDFDVDDAQRTMLEELKSWDRHSRLMDLWGAMVIAADGE
ncbi:hypothetical protein QBC41DRAFT_344244 [Cercophora samala]|uniref:C2H2-type domain-containing protein n=1 Tax=Cercophora samala TaxID=330535 RepID=A0AA39ZJP2_9PEZI|nr:hypothetical protein QBC41DRAFT_344244 [Cercophora samala]